MARTLALVLALLALSSTGCSFLVHFDRDRIGSDGGIDAGAIRDGGSYETRMGGIACWNALMDENNYMVQKWNEFVAA